MEPFSQRRNGTCRQARTDELCQIVRVLNCLAQHLPPPLPPHPCRFAPIVSVSMSALWLLMIRHLADLCKVGRLPGLPESRVPLYRWCTDVGISCPFGQSQPS